MEYGRRFRKVRLWTNCPRDVPLNSVLRFFQMFRMIRAHCFGSVGFLMQLLGTVRAFEFMALTGNTQQSGGQHNQGK